MDEIPDQELPGYCLIHCAIERTSFHKRDLARLCNMAGQSEDSIEILRRDKEWYCISPRTIRKLVRKIPGYETIVTTTYEGLQ